MDGVGRGRRISGLRRTRWTFRIFPTRRAGWRSLALAAAVLATVTACGSGGGATWQAGLSPTTPPPSRPASPTPSKSATPPTPTPTPTPTASGPAADVKAAADYAAAHHVRTGIAVLDLRTGRFYGAGHDTEQFGSASVMKVLVAARLLATGQMTGPNEALGTAMIERSDDDAVAQLWPLAGGPDVLPWVAGHYHIGGLGSPNTRAGYWGNTHITAKGMVYLYRALIKDPAVGPWLLDKMRHATRTAADGTDQFFGIPSVTSGAAIKQGWGEHSADNPNDAIINTTGYVDNDRYAVAILAEGQDDNDTTNADGYNAALAAIVNHLAALVLPGGRVTAAG